MAHAFRFVKAECVVPSARAQPVGGNRLHLWLFFAVFFFAAGRATEGAPTEPRVHFTVFCPRPPTGLGFAPRAGAAVQPLAFYPTARSPRYEYRGTMPLRLVDQTSGAVVAEATVPAAITEALLLLVPVEPTAVGVRFRVYVLDDSAARQAPGTLAVINLSGLPLTGTLGDEPLTLTDGLNAPHPLPRAAKLALHTPFKTKSYQAYAGEIALGKNERALLLLLPPFYKGSFEVQSRLLRDAPPAVTR
jgi:hypothetical protein